MEITLFGIYLFLAIFLCGNMTTLQIQHYGIYPAIGKDSFKNYMQANNKSALVPSIMPAMLMLIVNLLLVFVRPTFMPSAAAMGTLLLNLIALASTIRWQRRVQGEMALTGYDESKINLMIRTNWIRTVIFFMQALIVLSITIHAIG